MLEVLCIVSALLFITVSPAPDNFAYGQPKGQPIKSGPEFWNEQARQSIHDALKLKHVDGVAKNVIFFLGDGMSLATVTASRILKGQKKGQPGEEESLSWEKFKNVALMKTYNVDKQVPDSAGTATAYLCGVKANYETVGVSEKAKLGNCDTLEGNQVTSILEWSQNEGKLTGFITTARVTHASPAGLYAHSVSRYWESDVDKAKSPGSENCKDIASQLIEDIPGSNINLIMGGGRSNFFPNDTVDDSEGHTGVREDRKNLVDEWMKSKEKCNGTYKYLSNVVEFEDWDPKDTDFVLGLFGQSHMEYEVDRITAGPRGEPSIAQMTKKAIQMLSKGPKGYFLFVEGGRIDHGHHDNLAVKALNEAVAMDAAVQMALDMTSEEETLIIVTADHSHVMTINGYPPRGNPIFGIADVSDMDNLPYTTIMYTNGKGFARTPEGARPNISTVDTAHKEYRPLTAVPVTFETHGGDDVPLYARGPMAHLFYGVKEQNYIPHALAYASCVGVDKRNCWYRNGSEEVEDDNGNGNGRRNGARIGAATFNRMNNVLVVVLASIVCMCSKHMTLFY